MERAEKREEREGIKKYRQRDDRRGRPVTEDERVREKEGISSQLGDEKPDGGGRKREGMIERSRRWLL